MSIPGNNAIPNLVMLGRCCLRNKGHRVNRTEIGILRFSTEGRKSEKLEASNIGKAHNLYIFNLHNQGTLLHF